VVQPLQLFVAEADEILAAMLDDGAEAPEIAAEPERAYSGESGRRFRGS